MSCDEAVIQKLGVNIRADYSVSLLNLATGHRLFSITPLAFGEGNPTGRVRNLAKWKRPAFWVTTLCMVLCIVLAVCLLTNSTTGVTEEMDSTANDPAQPVETVPLETEPAEADDWGVSFYLDSFNRYGAGIIFDCTGGKGSRLRFDYDFSLEKMVDGSWTAVEELTGYVPNVDDKDYEVEDGCGPYHEWQDRFGVLADGQYRLGKCITLVDSDGTSRERMYYAQFSLESTRHPLLDFPKTYDTGEVIRSGGFIQDNGVAIDVIGDADLDNKGNFHRFAVVTQGGMPASIRIINRHYGAREYFTVSDLEFDGHGYMLYWVENEEVLSKQFRYLKGFTGELENSVYSYYEHYVLLDDNAATWSDIENGRLDDQAYVIVYTDYKNNLYSYEYVSPAIPENLICADLVFEDEVLITVTNPVSLEKIYQMFSTAEIISSEPKTHSMGVGLFLILTAQSGETVSIDLDLDSDHCNIGGAYVHYGVYDESSYLEKLWEYLGISQWPAQILEKYPNANRA